MLSSRPYQGPGPHSCGHIWLVSNKPSIAIISNAVHEYAHEPYENIIIKDLEDCSVELIEYRVRDKDAVIYNRYYNTELGLYSTNIAFEGNQVYDQLKNLEDG